MYILEVFKLISRELRSDTGFVYNSSRFISKGITLWKKKSRLVVPAELLGLSSVLMLLSIILHNILYYESLNWMNKVIDYGWSSVYLSSTYVILVYKKEIQALSEEVDHWWKYTYLEKETAQLKKKAEDWMKNFEFYYTLREYHFTLYPSQYAFQFF